MTTSERDAEYGVHRDDFGNVVSIDLPEELLNDSMRDACQALLWYATNERSQRHLDDSENYTDAAARQIALILDTLRDEHWDRLVAALNFSEEAIMESYGSDDWDIEDWTCFKLGWADHGTPISSIAKMNVEA